MCFCCKLRSMSNVNREKNTAMETCNKTTSISRYWLLKGGVVMRYTGTPDAITFACENHQKFYELTTRDSSFSLIFLYGYNSKILSYMRAHFFEKANLNSSVNVHFLQKITDTITTLSKLNRSLFHDVPKGINIGHLSPPQIYLNGDRPKITLKKRYTCTRTTPRLTAFEALRN